MHLKPIDNIQLNDKKHFILFFFLLIALSAAMMIFYSPLHTGHDIGFHLVRFEVLMDALKNGHFPYYIDYDAIEGYGYFTKAFYSDAILIPFAILGNLTNVIFAYNAMIFTMTVLCGLFTYMAVKKIFNNNTAAAISSILYTFCLYRLLDVFQRAALGESLSFTFIPLIYLGLYHIIKGDYKKWYILSIGFSLMIYTHAISSALTFVTVCLFLLIYNKYLRKEPKRLIYLMIAAFATLLLTSYYIFPMFEQVISNTYYFHTNPIFLPQYHKKDFYWFFWSLFGGGVQPRQLFVPAIGFLLSMAVCIRLFVFQKTKQLKHADMLIIVSLLFLVAVTPIFPWHIYPFKLLKFIQFPWRLYAFISFFFAVAGGYYFALAIPINKRLIVGYMLIITSTLFIMLNDSNLYKDIHTEYRYEERNTANNYLLGGLEYIPSSVPSVGYIVDRGDTITTENKSEVYNISKSKGILTFNVKLSSGNDIAELPFVYYKGYTAYIDNQKLTVSQSENGLVSLTIPQSGKVKAYYQGTITQQVSIYITIIGILALVAYIILLSRQRKHRCI